jgi:hypothetical protein
MICCTMPVLLCGLLAQKIITYCLAAQLNFGLRRNSPAEKDLALAAISELRNRDIRVDNSLNECQANYPAIEFRFSFSATPYRLDEVREADRKFDLAQKARAFEGSHLGSAYDLPKACLKTILFPRNPHTYSVDRLHCWNQNNLGKLASPGERSYINMDVPPPANGGSNPLSTGSMQTSGPSSGTPILQPDSKGVLGVKNLHMSSDGALSSAGKEVKLDSGIQILIHAEIDLASR